MRPSLHSFRSPALRAASVAFSTLALFVGAFLLPQSAAAQGGNLTLRVNDANARPGGVAALVLRTYAPRPIRQGQFCFISGFRLNRAGASPFESLEEVVVFSETGDAITLGTFENGAAGQTVMVEFTSATAGINRSDGPLAVIYLRLAPGVVAGDLIDVNLDLANTFLVDENGDPVPVQLRGGELEILAATDPLELSAAGGRVRPGDVAFLGVETKEVLELGSGVVGFRYDPAIAAQPPTVSVDPRYGMAILDVDSSEPGLTVVSFTSPNGSLNQVPGSILSVNLLTKPGVPLGTVSPVFLDPSITAIKDAALQPVALALAGDVIEFVLRADPMFQDGFESGDFSGWTTSSP